MWNRIKRKPLKRGGLVRSTGLKRVGLRNNTTIKRKAIKRAPREFDKERFDKDWDFFNMLWENHPDKKCESCGVQLFGENKNYYHDHLIEKSVRPDLRYNPQNMALVCGECHKNKTNGYPTEIHRKLIDNAIKRFS